MAIKKISNKAWTVIFMVLSITSMLLTPLFMYVAYIVQLTDNPDTPIMTGYWVGFIFIVFPIISFIYSYARKEVDQNKKYIPLMVISIICTLVILLFLAIGMSVK